MLQTLSTNAELNEDRQNCVNLLQIPADLVKNYESQNYPNDDKTKCYVKCILSKMEFFDETNGFSVAPAAIATSEGSSETKRIIADKVKKCSFNRLETENACQWAYRGYECFKKEGLTLDL